MVTDDAVALPSRGPGAAAVPGHGLPVLDGTQLATSWAPTSRCNGLAPVLADLPGQPSSSVLGAACRHHRGGRRRPVDPMQLVVDVVFVLVFGGATRSPSGSSAWRSAAARKRRPGVMVIEGERPARGEDIPVGTFIEQDGTTTVDVAWQDRPAAVGERKEGVRVGDRAWEPGVPAGAVGAHRRRHPRRALRVAGARSGPPLATTAPVHRHLRRPPARPDARIDGSAVRRRQSRRPCPPSPTETGGTRCVSALQAGDSRTAADQCVSGRCATASTPSPARPRTISSAEGSRSGERHGSKAP